MKFRESPLNLKTIESYNVQILCTKTNKMTKSTEKKKKKKVK